MDLQNEKASITNTLQILQTQTNTQMIEINTLQKEKLLTTNALQLARTTVEALEKLTKVSSMLVTY